MLRRVVSIALLCVVSFSLGPGVSPASAQPQFVAIDMITTDLGAQAANREAPQLIGGSPLILVVEDVGVWYVRAMTVDANTGAPLGRTVDITFPPSPCAPPNPCDLIYSEYFLPGQVIVLGDDGTLVAFPISITPDGTPNPSAGICHPPEPGLSDLGPACAITEMPGTAFGDGVPRLFVGTESGMIAMFVFPVGAAPMLEGVIDLLAGQPITALGVIPQMTGPVLGAAVGRQIVGIINPEVMPAVQFGVINPDVLPVADFVGVAPGPPDSPVYIAFCDGVNIKVPRAQLPADAAGTSTMILVPPDPVIPILSSPPVGLALGSMLMLTLDGQGVYYDPGFDVQSGPSYCIADINDPLPALCVECPVTFTGDVNQNNSLTSADIILLIGFIFKSLAPPEPCEAAGDVNCNGTVNSSDVIYLVNHIFKDGPPPCDVCSIWLDPWTCP